MAFPSTFSTFARPSTTSRLNNPSHSTLHNDTSSALGQLEAVVGLEGDSSTLGTLIGDLRSPDSDGGGHIQKANKGGTGQTSYTKGDVLVAQSSSALSKLAIGSDDQVLIADSSQNLGLKWGATPVIQSTSTIAASSVWTKPAAAGANSRVFVELWGGGGSGGHGIAGQEESGGGGGGYACGWFNASILTSVLINVGKGGDSVKQNDGQGGSITVFGVDTSMLTAYGGGGGADNGSGALGGGGGGSLESGKDSSGTTGFAAAREFGGYSNGSGTFIYYTGAVNDASSVRGSGQFFRAPQGGAGGYAGSGETNPASAIGMSAIYGGGGGGAITSSMVSGSALGGLSTFGGNGGNSSIIIGVGSAMAGSIPGGGGGAAWGNNSSSSGEGGKGMARITTFL